MSLLMIVKLLGGIVAVDHALAATDLVKANSTGQMILNGLAAVGQALLNVFKGSSES